MIQISSLRLPVDHTDADLRSAALAALKCDDAELKSLTIRKRSIDARTHRKEGVFFQYILEAEVADETAVYAKCGSDPNIQPPKERNYAFGAKKTSNAENRPVIIGAGPCGLFAALLLARHGRRPILLERGKPVGPRARDVTKHWREGTEIDPDSNVQFGEGGAGAFSDGKLYTQIKDREHRARWVLEQLAEHGAPSDILIKGRPHIGTDRLMKVLRLIRAKIEELGGEYRFGTRVDSFVIEKGTLRGLKTSTGEEMECSEAVLAVGHSARDTFAVLKAAGIPMEAKPFSIGARIEHPQKLIDRSFFGKQAGHPLLGSSPYKFVHHGKNQERTTYSFCMCPGGLVVGSSSEPGAVVTNGMSSYARDEANANSGFMVEVSPEDFDDPDDPLSGIAFQRRWERKAYEIGGNEYHAPAQRLGDLLAQRPSKEPGNVSPSYRPGVVWTDLRECLPEFVVDSIRDAIPHIARKIPDFALEDAVLTAAETRSSSPLRIDRDPETLQCPSASGLYPAGEGAGYAGGIVSAAVDGLRVAEKIVESEA
ncbi:MAG: FAD-dependent protein [Verrucomicrobiota bacterium]